MRFMAPNPRLFAKIIGALANIVSETNFVASPEGLRVRAMDESRVMLIEVDLPREFFYEYECDQEEKLGVNLTDINKLLKKTKSSDTIEMISEKGQLKLVIQGEIKRSFSFPILSLAGEEIPELSIPMKVNAKVVSSALKRAVTEASLMGEILRFEASVDNLDELKTYTRSERGEATFIFSRDSGSLLSLEVEENSKAGYGINYLEDIVKTADAAETANIQFSTDAPIKIEFELEGGGKIRYYLAPRVESA